MGIAYINLADNAFEELADPEGDGRMNAVRMNDGKVDRQGRFILRDGKGSLAGSYLNSLLIELHMLSEEGE